MLQRVIALASVAVLGSAGAVHAQDIKLPPTMAVTAYDTGTAGFNIAVAVGKMMKDKYSTVDRVLPAFACCFVFDSATSGANMSDLLPHTASFLHVLLEEAIAIYKGPG